MCFADEDSVTEATDLCSDVIPPPGPYQCFLPSPGSWLVGRQVTGMEVRGSLVGALCHGVPSGAWKHPAQPEWAAPTGLQQVTEPAFKPNPCQGQANGDPALPRRAGLSSAAAGTTTPLSFRPFAAWMDTSVQTIPQIVLQVYRGLGLSLVN